MSEANPIDRVVIESIKQAKCPECGDRVFIPALRFPPKDPEDPEVWCREFGHWAGKLSECANKYIYRNHEAL